MSTAGGIDGEAFWQNARRLIPLDARKINLNAGTLWPTPIPVLNAVDRFRRMMAGNPSDFVWRQLPPLITAARTQLAEYLHCEPADLLLLPNITFAINILTASLRLKPGSEILTTDHEYGAMLYAWQRLARRDGLQLSQIRLPYDCEDPREIVDAFERGVSDDTRVIFFSHVTTSTGLLMPAAELCMLARQRGVLSVVDGAHAPGMVSVDLSQIRADFYAANCHKWVMAPAGAGFMHVAPHRKSMLAPVITSWGYAHDPAKAEEDSGNGGTRWQWDLEFHGTADRCPQMAIPAALELRVSLGGDDAVIRRNRSLSAHARRVLTEKCGLKCATPASDGLGCGAIVAFEFPTDDVIKTRDRLWHEHHIECPVTSAAGKTFLRVSTAWFNTDQEIDALADAVGQL
jgi:isopenicillin-N epimerase